MSTVATTVSVQSLLAGWTRQVARMYAVDLRHLPESKFTSPYGGVCRSAQSFTAEAAGMCLMTAGVVKGGDIAMPAPEAAEAYGAQFTDPATAGRLLVEAADTLAAALEAASDVDLARQITAPWGAPLAVAELANIAANHLMYHDGHVTFIQMLEGDGEMHWMEAFETA